MLSVWSGGEEQLPTAVADPFSPAPPEPGPVRRPMLVRLGSTWDTIVRSFSKRQPTYGQYPELQKYPTTGIEFRNAQIQVPLLKNLFRELGGARRVASRWSAEAPERTLPVHAISEEDPRLASISTERVLSLLQTYAQTLRLQPWSAMANNIMDGKKFSDGVDLTQLTLTPPALSPGSVISPPTSNPPSHVTDPGRSTPAQEAPTP